MKVERVKHIPKASLANKYLPADYFDVYRAEANTCHLLNADDIMLCFWTNSPKWVRRLFQLRNTIVSVLGLQGTEASDRKERLRECIKEGVKYKLFERVDRSENENILLLADTHLDAYISVYVEQKDDNTQAVFVSTLVNFHNRLGHTYFAIIKPFHALVVKGTIKRAIKMTVAT